MPYRPLLPIVFEKKPAIDVNFVKDRQLVLFLSYFELTLF